MLYGVLRDLETKASGKADWRRVAGLWEQCVAILEAGDRAYLPEWVTGKLARAMGHVFASYDEAEDEYVEHLLAVMASADGRAGDDLDAVFRDLYHDDRFKHDRYRTADGRRLPLPFEAAVETARRHRDLARIRDQLNGRADLGGSASYGRFRNTVGARDDHASDLDLLLVLAPGVAPADVYRELQTVRAVADAERAIDRSEGMAWPEEAAPGSPDAPIFSHKLGMWRDARDPLLAPRDIAGGYTLSTHILTLRQFHWITLGDHPVLRDGLDRRVWDLRDTEPTRQDRQRTFAGTEHPVERRCERVERAGWPRATSPRSPTSGFGPGCTRTSSFRSSTSAGTCDGTASRCRSSRSGGRSPSDWRRSVGSVRTRISASRRTREPHTSRRVRARVDAG